MQPRNHFIHNSIKIFQLGTPLMEGYKMYVIISKRNHQWLSKIDKEKGIGSSHYVKTGNIPMLFETRELARIELLMYHLSQNKYQIVEVQIRKINSDNTDIPQNIY